MGDEQIDIELSGAELDRKLGLPERSTALPVTLTAPAQRVRRGSEVKLVLTDGSVPERDERMVALLAEARSVRERILAAPARNIQDHAAEAGQCRHRLTQLFRLAYLAPDIVDAIVSGAQPPKLSARVLLSAKLPLAWSEQKVLLGFV